MNKKTLLLAVSALLPLSFSIGASVLLEGDELRLTYKNYYFNESVDSIDNSHAWGAERDEWVHAAILDYSTGFINDWIQFEYGVAAADDLHIGSGVNNVTNLPGATAANGYEPDSLLGTQTAYITTRYQGDGFTLSVGAGKKARSAPVYRDSVSRIIDASSVGYDISANVGALKLYYTELHKLSLRNEDDWGESLRNFNGDRIDALRYFGGQYRFGNGLSLELAQAESQDYIRERLARARYRLPLSSQNALLFGASYGTLAKDGELFGNDAALPFLSFFDENLDASYYELSAGYRWPGHVLSLNFSNVIGGDLNHNLASSEIRHWDASSQYAWSWYGLEGEDALSLLSLMDFTRYGMPSLSWNAGIWFSDDAKGFKNFKRYEFTSMLGYEFSGELDGLSLQWLYSYHRAKGELDGVSRTAYPLGPAGLERKDVNRLYLTYTQKF